MGKMLKDPYLLIAEALEINVSELNEKSGYGDTPNWDSLGQLGVIDAIETNYAIEIANDDIERYLTMKSILVLHKQLSSSQE